MFGQELPIFPETVRNAIWKIFARVFGIVLSIFLVFSVWTIAAGVENLQTWTNFSTYPEAGFFTNVIDLCVYAIGKVPFLLVILFLFRPAILLILGKRRAHPEMTAMQVFIAVMSLSAALAFLFPVTARGGIFGMFLSRDLRGLFGTQTDVVFGATFLGVFLMLFGIVLRITVGRILNFFYKIGHALEWPIEKIFGGKEEDYEEASFIRPARRKRVVKKRTVKKHRVRRRKVDYKEDEDENEYELPPPELLERSSFAGNVVTREHREIAASMEVNFAKYGILGNVREIHPGPIVTRYDFEPEDGQKINKIMETATDMRRAMATEQIRIALVPRTRYIGVEMVNPNRQFVYYQTLMSNPEFMESKMQIPLALGVEISGRPFYADLAKMPHILIAGRTGSGKSVFMQSIIMSIVYRNRPDEVKMVVVDPKGVDFNKWRDIPHLITPIVTDASSAVNVLKWAVREMEDRYKVLQSVDAQKISDYNDIADKMNARGKTLKKKVPVGTDKNGVIEYEIRETELERMPHIVLIMDEIADLMQQARKDVEACVQRITQKARAAGIHLVAATQRPDTSVITGVIKSNLPTRISFQARSYIDSMTTLGERGAEMLLAQGDMLYSESGKQPIRIHGAFIQDKEIDRVAKFLRAQSGPDYVDGITESADDSDNSLFGLPPGKDAADGDLYNQAMEIVLRDKRPTISYLQMRLGIGYMKAAKLIERMHESGIIRKKPDGKYEIA
jgi:S-DNA-T family DNA segregation ATPase FtsK/SpoIIIE